MPTMKQILPEDSLEEFSMNCERDELQYLCQIKGVQEPNDYEFKTVIDWLPKEVGSSMLTWKDVRGYNKYSYGALNNRSVSVTVHAHSREEAVYKIAQKLLNIEN